MSYVGGNALEIIKMRQAIQKLSKSLGVKAVPTFGGLEAINSQIVSILPDGGLSPIKVVSKVLCSNLNVEYLGGFRAANFLKTSGGVVQTIIATTPILTSGGVRPTLSLDVVPANLGGTGIANNVLSTLAISGNFGTTLTVTAATALTLPTAGYLAYSTVGTYAPIDNYINQAVLTSSSPSFVRGTFTEGTLSPFAITSNVVNTNLNADLLDGEHASAFQDAHANLTSLAALSYASASFVKMTSANTFALRTLQQTSDDLEATIDHDNLLNFAATEHIDWTANTANDFLITGTLGAGAITGTALNLIDDNKINLGTSVDVSLYYNGTTNEFIFDPVNANGRNFVLDRSSLVVRTDPTWGGWARELLRIDDGTSSLFQIGGYGSTGSSIKYIYMGNLYNDAFIKIDQTNRFALGLSGATRPTTAMLEVWGSGFFNTTLGVTGLTTATGGIKIGTLTGILRSTSGSAVTTVTPAAKASYNNWAALGDVVNALVALGLFDTA